MNYVVASLKKNTTYGSDAKKKVQGSIALNLFCLSKIHGSEIKFHVEESKLPPQ